jgi:hypothetical protein
LVKLDLSWNKLTGQFFFIFRDGQFRLTIWFFVQFYAGGIPASLGNLANLQKLWLHNNQLSGNFLVVLEMVVPHWPLESSSNFTQASSLSPWETWRIWGCCI